MSSQLKEILNKLKLGTNSLIALSSLFGIAGLYHLDRHELGYFIVYTVIYYLINMNIDKKSVNNMIKNVFYFLLFIYLLFTSYDLANHYLLMLVLGVMLVLWYVSSSCVSINNNMPMCVANKEVLSMTGNDSIFLVLMMAVIYLQQCYCHDKVLDISKPFIW